jgi:hypothetical protein
MSRTRRVQPLADGVKGRQVIRQRRAGASDAQLKPTNLNRPSLNPSDKPYLAAAQAAEYVCSPSIRAFYAWVDRRQVRKCHRGRRLVFLRRDLDEALQRERQEEPRQA